MSEQNESFEYTLSNFEKDFTPFSEAFRSFCEGKNIDQAKIFDLELSLEELVVNSFSYGNENGPVIITAELQEGELKVVMADKAPPFDLLRDAPEPPVGSLMDRQVGGLGIHLVKSLNDRVEYSGSNSGNQITLFKSLKT